MVYCVGLTGGIASGKSTVAKLFANLGIEIIDADKISKTLTTKEGVAYDAIIDHFDASILDEHQNISRKTLRQIVFENPKERTWLENLLHPLIRQKISQKVQQCQGAYCMIEIPLLERKNYPYIHRILLIETLQNIQISRLQQRDNSNTEQSLAIIAAQADNQQRRLQADDILINNGSLKELEDKVYELHKKYLNLSLQ